MSGRLASRAIAQAGVPEQVFTVPPDKILVGTILVLNGTAGPASVQIKTGQGLTVPVASFPFSNARLIAGQGRGGFPGSVYGAHTLSLSFRGDGTGFDAATGSTLVRVNLASALAPVVAPGLNPLSPNVAFARDERLWNAPSAGDQFWSSDNGTLRRYLDTTSSPFRPGSTVYQVTGIAHGAGNNDRCVAIVAGDGPDQYRYLTSAPATAGSAAGATLPIHTGTFSLPGADLANPQYTRVFWANGVWFLAHVNASNMLQLWSTPTPDLPGSWVAHAQIHLAARDITRLVAVHHIAGYFNLITVQSSTFGRWIIPDNLPGATPTWTSVMSSGSSLMQTLTGFLRADGRMMTHLSGAKSLDLTVLETVSADWPASAELGPNYATVSGKLSPVVINALHAIPRPGATDTDNDLLAYGTDRIWNFVEDTTWGLQHVTSNADWLDPSETVAANGAVEYRPRLFSPGDAIWVRSSVAGLTVRIEGFLSEVQS